MNKNGLAASCQTVCISALSWVSNANSCGLSHRGWCMILERVTGFEPVISCLGSKRSTTELYPLNEFGRQAEFTESGRRDLNPGLLAPHASALAGLRYAPINERAGL